MSTGYNFLDMLMGKPRPEQNNMGMSQDPRKLFSPLRKAGIAADSLVLRGYGTGQQLREQGLQEAQFELAQNQRADTIKGLQQRAAAGDKAAASLLMAVQNRSLTPSDAMKIYFRQQFQKPSKTVSQMTGAQLNERDKTTVYDPKKVYNVGSDGNVTAVGGGGLNINLGDEGKMLLKEGSEETKRILGDYRNAQKAATNIALQRQMINSQDFRSGFGADLITNTKKLFSQLGFGDAGVSTNETFRNIANQQVLDRLGGSLGVGVSEGDLAFMKEMVANIGMTKEGITEYLMIQEIMAEQANREYNFMVDYIKQQDQALGRQTGFVQNPYLFAIELQNHLAALPPLFEE